MFRFLKKKIINSKNKHIALGYYGEKVATKYLLKKGYKIIERNFLKPWGEIDIIAIAPDKTLVFFEVKTTTPSPDGLTPEDQMTASKIKKVVRTASIYANSSPFLNDSVGWRIDCIAIDADNKLSLRHYENIGVSP